MFRLTPRRRQAAELRALLACPRCDADALCPMHWETHGERHWLMNMRCGACGSWLEMLVPDRMAAQLDLELDRQQAQIAAAADALERERMAAEVEALIAALQRDLIDASDFAR